MIKYFTRCRRLQATLRILLAVLAVVVLIWSFRIFPLDSNIGYEFLAFLFLIGMLLSTVEALLVLRCVISDAQEDLRAVENISAARRSFEEENNVRKQ